MTLGCRAPGAWAKAQSAGGHCEQLAGVALIVTSVITSRPTCRTAASVPQRTWASRCRLRERGGVSQSDPSGGHFPKVPGARKDAQTSPGGTARAGLRAQRWCREGPCRPPGLAAAAGRGGLGTGRRRGRLDSTRLELPRRSPTAAALTGSGSRRAQRPHFPDPGHPTVILEAPLLPRGLRLTSVLGALLITR